MADTATQNKQEEKGEEVRYESMLEFLNVNVKRARRPSSGVFEVSKAQFCIVRERLKLIVLVQKN